ncbi:MAG: NADH:flavin oxidoreductase/NADH oxidase, partial [Proteobacteria bacterium]|nr:NADH:flavin oxidoreductase/NADH oxidase [Pseudomonadota bacterium]
MKSTPFLFTPLKIRDISFRNRIFVSPMCQYSASEGIPSDWHLVHLGSRAVGGAGLVMAEATAVSEFGRISPADTGLWSSKQVASFNRISQFIKSQGAVPAIQLAHAGRKASTAEPWKGGKPISEKEGGWNTLAPSAIAFSSGYPTPKAMEGKDISQLISDFEKSTQYAVAAGFEVVEIHMAHGYLLHEFLSPLTNQRQDEFGGSLENRMRLPLKIAEIVRKSWPENLPVFVRISATDWVEGGWELSQSIQFCKKLKGLGIDFIDVSTGGTVPDAKIPVAPSFQVPFAKSIRKEVGILTGAVGLITEAVQAESILESGAADAILM